MPSKHDSGCNDHLPPSGRERGTAGGCAWEAAVLFIILRTTCNNGTALILHRILLTLPKPLQLVNLNVLSVNFREENTHS